MKLCGQKGPHQVNAVQGHFNEKQDFKIANQQNAVLSCWRDKKKVVAEYGTRGT